MKKILVIGAAGQIGSELVPALRLNYGEANVVASDINPNATGDWKESGPFEVIDALSADSVSEVVKKYNIDAIYNLAALLSARGEADPQLAWKVNMGALLNILEIAKAFNCSIFTPSSIGAFGPDTPRDNTPQDTIQRPTTMYGVTKVAAELLSDYYHLRFGVDARSVRFPGIISNVTPPGGGTTDYAVDIYYAAVENRPFSCFLAQGTYLDMMYMPDALRAAMELMEADSIKLKHHNSFNVTAMSFAPEEIYAAIKRRKPEFSMDYQVDPVRQAIADSWPRHMDDTAARTEWGWNHRYDLEKMTDDMLDKLTKRLNKC
jgi:nucleoside-diphosphate-sugar epimerase